MNQAALCPCCSGNPFNQCCHPFLENKQLPQQPEQLMRSRYSAFATQNYDYIKETNFSAFSEKTDADSMAEDFNDIHWLRLAVEDAPQTTSENDTGWVSFAAFYGIKGKLYVLREKSTFKRVDGKWMYDIDHSHSEVERIKLSRNDPCICQSGKKFKKCCEPKLV